MKFMPVLSIRKVHSFRPYSFSSPFGPIGYVAEEWVCFALAPARCPPRLTYGGGAPVVPILEAGPVLKSKRLKLWRRERSMGS